MPNFAKFASVVEARFSRLAATGSLFVVDLDKDELWNLYLDSFPSGTNEIYRERRYYDCSCCRQFIKNVGNVVAISEDGDLRTIWQVPVEAPFQVVANNLDDYVASKQITDVFRTKELKFGAQQTIEHVPGAKCFSGGQIIRWDHFHCTVPNTYYSKTPQSDKGVIKSKVGVLLRSLTEISDYAVQTVQDLIADNQLYRGTQYAKQLTDFQKAKENAWPDVSLYAWSLHAQADYLGLRNTAIGTLLTDLTEGRDVEAAVASFEQKVAPINYRRSTAPITKGMVEQSVAKLKELGLESALQRRHATALDVSINAVLWANRSTASVMKDSVTDLLMAEVKGSTKQSSSVQEVTIAEFLTNILPSATKLEVLFENQHLGNLVSVTAPVDPDAGKLFSWDNNFAWSYRGNVTDSIKERVRKAGGNVEGVGRVSLSWFNYDDLDIHMYENKSHIYYGDKQPCSAHAKLDVDMNAGGGHTREAVENITWARSIPDGTHTVKVHNYNRRETTDVGFVVEVELPSTRLTLSYPKAVPIYAYVDVCTITVNNGACTVTPASGMVVGEQPKEEYGIKTNQFHEVNMVMISPNHWEAPTGNKHWFFIINCCATNEPVRGIYNEFLRSDLNPHRKVFEVLASKMMCPPAEQQLSGLGFSETIRNYLVVRIDGRQYKVIF